MKAATINTIACIVPIDNSDDSQLQEIYSFKQKTIDEGQELFATVDNEDLQWKFDRIVENTTTLNDECCKLIDSVLEGYNAAYFSLSVSDGHRHTMDEQRNQTLKVIFNQFDDAISNSKESFEIEFAFLGLMLGECYDVRKKIIRSNESMEARGIDSIMRRVDHMGKIRDLMLDRESAIPYLVSIKITNTNTMAIGRFSIIDLLYSPFSPSIRDNTLNSIQDIISALTTPKYTGLMHLGSSFLAKEITKYICGHNELLMTLYLNDQIVNEAHSRNTRFLLSMVSSFTGMPVRSFPNVIISNNAELKKLRSEIKKLSKQREKLEKLHKHLVSQLHERTTTIERLEEMKKDFETNLPQVRAEHRDESKLFDIMLTLKRKEIQYLETTLLSKSFLHEFDLQQYRIEIAKLNTMLDIKNFSEEDVYENAKRMDFMYEEPILQLEHRDKALKATLSKLHANEAELKENISSSEKDEEVYHESDESIDDIVESEEVAEPEEIVELKKSVEPEEDAETEEIEMEDETLPSQIEELEKEIALIDEKIREIGKSEFREKMNYKEELEKFQIATQELQKECKAKRANVKAQANERMKKLAEKHEEVFVAQSQHIYNLKRTLMKEKGEIDSDDDFQSEEERAPLKRRKVASDNDDEE